MADDRKSRPGSGSRYSSDLSHKKFNRYEGQSRFMTGSNKSRALDKFVERDREKVKRHNRLIDLKREEDKKSRKHGRRTEEDDLPPVPQFKFGKESIADAGYSELRSETLVTRKQQEREKLETKKAAEEKKASNQKKRKRVDFGAESDSDSERDDKPPKKVAKDAKDAEDSNGDKKEEAPQAGDAENAEQNEVAKKAGKPARSFQEARARYEEKQRLRREKEEAYQKRQQDIAQKQEQMKKTSAKLRQRTSRGQPIMKNVLSHMMSKLKAPGPGSK